MRRVEGAAVLLVFAVLVGVIAFQLSDLHLFVVSGSSMEPAIAKGSLIVVRGTSPDTVGVGDVVTFEHRGQVVTHRVAAIDGSGPLRAFTTAGDANPVADPERIAFHGQVGLVQAQVPFAGYALATLTANARALGLVLAATFAVLALRRIRGETFPSPASA